MKKMFSKHKVVQTIEFDVEVSNEEMIDDVVEKLKRESPLGTAVTGTGGSYRIQRNKILKVEVVK